MSLTFTQIYIFMIQIIFIDEYLGKINKTTLNQRILYEDEEIIKMCQILLSSFP
jgi:hypothetical protein